MWGIPSIFSRNVVAGVALAILATVVWQTPAQAQETYQPGIWIDPDGCEHWVMDDGVEGYMSPRRTRDGRPVCRRSEICGILPTDWIFATNSVVIAPASRDEIARFFDDANAFGFLVYGHTDSRASDEYNMSLSQRRADAIASIGYEVGARIVDARGLGERMPRASNATAAGQEQNRRVEVYCLR